MKPLKLLLEGFEGIFSAFGRNSIELDLRKIPDDASIVALVAPNGGGKTTLLENLHPYRIMPSRSTTLGPGGFSYWTQIRGPSALKDLLWEHDGVLYHTVLSFKSTGKTQKSDCYLYQWNQGVGDWTPVQLADGTVSDGKTATYDHCVDSILGPPEKFFTAHFSAQKRKTIASYQTGEIKSILASVLNLQRYRELSAGAAQVGKLLRQQLAAINDELAEARDHERAVGVLADEVRQIDRLIQAGSADEVSAQAGLTSARDTLFIVIAKRDAQAKDAEEIRFLNEQISAVVTKAASNKASVAVQFERQSQMHMSEIEDTKSMISAAQRELQSSEIEVRRLNEVLAERDAIAQASARLPGHQQEIAQVDVAIEAHQLALSTAPALRQELTRLTGEHARLKSEGVAKVIVIEKLAATAALIEKVPCKGSEMQQSCPLMSQANAAAREIPGHTAEQDAKREAYATLGRRLKEVQAQVAELDGIEAAIRMLQSKRKAVATALEADTRLAARGPLIVDAETRLPALKENIEQQRQNIANATERMTRASAALEKIGAEQAEAVAALEKAKADEVRVLEERLARLEKPVTDAEVNALQTAVANAGAALVEVQGRARAHTEQKVALLGRLEAMRALAERSSQVKLQAERLQEEIAKWKVLEKGLGNDGCVALSIDDAGPEIAAICNGLLSDCFEGRFIVRLDTQRQTQAGDTRETFDVKVFDGHRGSEKSLGDMSGGEEILVNECLTRSVALYASQTSTANCQTLFTDETDGALDPEAKRTFMQMKRAVLKQGGYQREYFITHTPELWEMADFKIKVAEL